MITLLKFEDVPTPQVKCILRALNDFAGIGGSIAFQDLVAHVANDPEFKSRQDPLKVVRYYEKHLTDDGFIKVEGSEKPPSPEGMVKVSKLNTQERKELRKERRAKIKKQVEEEAAARKEAEAEEDAA